MVKGRGKGKKQYTAAAGEDAASDDEEKILVRRRGRPQKLLKDDMDEEEEFDKMEKEDQEESSSVKNSVPRKDLKNPGAAKNKRKRKRPNITKKSLDLVKEENGIEDKANAMKTVGLKKNGSRRKNKPHRAAEVGVEC